MKPQRRNYKAWTRASFLILLGCIPATYLCFFALPLAISGIFGFIAGDGWLSLGMGIWGIAGVLGTLSLWTISLGFPSPIPYFGLIVGVVANVLIPVLLPFSDPSFLFSLDLLIMFGPTIVAIYLWIELVYTAFRLGAKDRAKVTS